MPLRFDAIGQLAPRLPSIQTVGLEVLGGLEGFGELLGKAAAAAVERVDLKHALFVSQLNTIYLLRRLLQFKFGPSAQRSFYTLNMDREMIDSPVQSLLFKHYWDPLQADRVFIEAGEDVLAGQVEELGKLSVLHGFKIVQDDCNAANPNANADLKGRAIMRKIDASFTQHVLSRAFMPDSDHRGLVDTLIAHAGDVPFIIEGVGSESHYGLLQARCPESVGFPIYVQGWVIRVMPELEAVFEPVHTADEPRGYKLSQWACERIGSGMAPPRSPRCRLDGAKSA